MSISLKDFFEELVERGGDIRNFHIRSKDLDWEYRPRSPYSTVLFEKMLVCDALSLGNPRDVRILPANFGWREGSSFKKYEVVSIQRRISLGKIGAVMHLRRPEE